jgi:ABC transporter substrate binding protein
MAPGVRAQQKTMPVIGYLSSATPAANVRQLPAFRAGLKETGWDEGQNVAIEYRWAEDHYDRLPALAADLVGRRVDVIVSTGGIYRGAHRQKCYFHDPDCLCHRRRSGRARSDRQSCPAGRQSHGYQFSNWRADAKAARAALGAGSRCQGDGSAHQPEQCQCRAGDSRNAGGGTGKGSSAPYLEGQYRSEIDAVFAAPLTGALVVSTDPYFHSRRRQLVALASNHAVPAIYERREFPDEGGLISYGPSFTATWRQLGIYTGKILNGAKPADLPVQQPTTFELVVNLNTAKALGLTVPPSILARADEVIE